MNPRHDRHPESRSELVPDRARPWLLVKRDATKRTPAEPQIVLAQHFGDEALEGATLRLDEAGLLNRPHPAGQPPTSDDDHRRSIRMPSPRVEMPERSPIGVEVQLTELPVAAGLPPEARDASAEETSAAVEPAEDPDVALERVIDAWQGLPASVRAAITAMVDAIEPPRRTAG